LLRGYPKIFNDPDVGPEAKKVFDEAQAMLKTIVDQKLLQAHAAVGFYPANSTGDGITNIKIYGGDFFFFLTKKMLSCIPTILELQWFLMFTVLGNRLCVYVNSFLLSPLFPNLT
jgi:Vitamin B12 dependent methionine synthase, activation domain